METLFWFSVAFIVYVYVGLSRAAGGVGDGVAPAADVTAALRRSLRRSRPRMPLPGVSVIIAARNEAAAPAGAHRQPPGVRLPDGRLEIIVASDGSTDDTRRGAGCVSQTRHRC